jgi:aminoglycoside phosphotransferase (APT) family kinase protein
VDLVAIASAHQERAVVRAGGIYLKVETDSSRAENERAAMASAPVPTPTVLWWHDGPPALLALAAVPGTSLAKLGEPSPHPPAAWSKAGAICRQLHAAPPPARLARSMDEAGLPAAIAGARTWLLANAPVAAAVVEARAAFAHDMLDHRDAPAVFIHGDFQAEHVIIHDGDVAAIIDWADAGHGDPLFDLAVLTQGHRERLDDVIEGYGTDVDRDVVRGYWTLGKMRGVRWMLGHGFDASDDISSLINFSPD